MKHIVYIYIYILKILMRKNYIIEPVLVLSQSVLSCHLTTTFAGELQSTIHDLPNIMQYNKRHTYLSTPEHYIICRWPPTVSYH